VKVVKIKKPSDGQAITVELSHDQPTKVDLTATAKLILFDNRSTVTIEPYFASMNVASPNVTFEMISPSSLTAIGQSGRCQTYVAKSQCREVDV